MAKVGPSGQPVTSHTRPPTRTAPADRTPLCHASVRSRHGGVEKWKWSWTGAVRVAARCASAASSRTSSTPSEALRIYPSRCTCDPAASMGTGPLTAMMSLTSCCRHSAPSMRMRARRPGTAATGSGPSINPCMSANSVFAVASGVTKAGGTPPASRMRAASPSPRDITTATAASAARAWSPAWVRCCISTSLNSIWSEMEKTDPSSVRDRRNPESCPAIMPVRACAACPTAAATRRVISLCATSARLGANTDASPLSHRMPRKM